MKIEQVALQLYTLRNQCKTPDAIAASLKKVKEIGYQAVQASGLGPIPEAELVKILADEGLTLCATHEDGATILNSPDRVVERLQKLGCKHTSYPYPAGVDFSDMAQVKKLAQQLNAAGEVLHRAGQVLSYHNHAVEFIRAGSGTILDYIYENTDPRFLQAELDTYWVQYGGGDPAAWCRKMANRVPVMHMKDYRFTAKNQPEFGEIGYGNLDWKGILAAADASGCEWFVVEQDTCPGDPFDSVKMSFDYISANLCS